MASASEAILKATAEQPESAPITAKEFLHLGSRAAIDQALCRLVRSGQLARFGRGWYIRPVQTRFGERMPAPEKVLEAMAALKGERVAPSGGATANAYGVTTQVPTTTIYLTSGRSRRFKFGAQSVELRHAPSWQLRKGPAGEVARVLAWSGPGAAKSAVESLGKRFSPQERLEAVAARSGLPTWMAETLSPWANA
ncbi:MAG TPA: DUF6088 family protein [Methylomirabilota bacterium]|nr:DUF6088 family protein [Methylomirabilota bacterium]